MYKIFSCQGMTLAECAMNIGTSVTVATSQGDVYSGVIVSGGTGRYFYVRVNGYDGQDVVLPNVTLNGVGHFSMTLHDGPDVFEHVATVAAVSAAAVHTAEPAPAEPETPVTEETVLSEQEVESLLVSVEVTPEYAGFATADGDSKAGESAELSTVSGYEKEAAGEELVSVGADSPGKTQAAKEPAKPKSRSGSRKKSV